MKSALVSGSSVVVVDSSRPQGRIECTLVDRRSSVPLGGAVVMFGTTEGYLAKVRTNPAGRFSATLPEGVYDLLISTRGSLSLCVRGIGVLGSLVQTFSRGLVPERDIESLLPRASAIGGRVTNRLGRPVGGLNVHLVSNEPDGLVHTARLEKDGSYVVHGILPGSYAFSLRSGEWAIFRQDVEIPSAGRFVRYDPMLINA